MRDGAGRAAAERVKAWSSARRAAKLLLPPVVAEALRRILDRESHPYSEWEYLPSGWPPDATFRGWNAEGVATEQVQKWPVTMESAAGTGPFGLSNESPDSSGPDYAFHNTIMSYGYVLARAACMRRQLSMLDWGGGLGHYYVYAKSLIPGLELDYHCRELPILVAAGRTVLPEVQFHDDDGVALSRTFNLVVASGSIHYSNDWSAVVMKLAAVAEDHLYVTRVPIVDRAPSFVVLQRPYAYGYDTEYPGWFLNRGDLLAVIEAAGLVVDREFLVDERPPVVGAPEAATYRGFLFRRRS
jgi:putative methyltransferase (TIGR04325 family)